MIETWRRDDGWEVELELAEDGSLISTNHIPMVNAPRPDPLTYQYMFFALLAHGYVKI
ncbi:hypothetical protein SEA_WEASELS2_141 [Rhodococcus phage Weasels2]|uniref:Uncharacterized protein n=1 Tax=Rhodococcus phage Weasels2 TaxID=1897437 RepID=A0A1I9SAB9_9CAUD|nr:hypothetical protein FDH04_gp269 [Rhodococcus phage Weasels2]AOZ63725.1 hypothetical protein SEA_WEASELS2_141 [Rhodococcus phage Weasels2]